jgi:hypothetical protein
MSTPSRDGWTRCPPGSFRRLGAVLAARQLRRRWLTRLALAAAALLAMAACWETAVVVDAWQSGLWSRPKPTLEVGPPCPTPGDPPAPAPAQAPGCGAK